MADPAQYVRRGFSCAQSLIKIQGIEVGWATDVAFEESYNQFPVEVLNNVYVETHELTAVRVSGTFGKFRIYLEPLSQITGESAIWYDQNQETHQIIQFLEKELTLCNGANSNSPPLITLVGFKPSARRINIATGSLMMESASFVGKKLIETKSMGDFGGFAG